MTYDQDLFLALLFFIIVCICVYLDVRHHWGDDK